MSLEQAIMETVRTLPAEKQREILEHAARLQTETPATSHRRIGGLWADLGISLSAQEIDDNRRDMWQDFPRDDV